jgi:hypothetical protein
LIKEQIRGFAPIGMMEFWNHGMVGLENQNEYKMKGALQK